MYIIITSRGMFRFLKGTAYKEVKYCCHCNTRISTGILTFLYIHVYVCIYTHTLKDELPKSVGTQFITGEEWRNSSRKNEEAEPKQK